MFTSLIFFLYYIYIDQHSFWRLPGKVSPVVHCVVLSFNSLVCSIWPQPSELSCQRSRIPNFRTSVTVKISTSSAFWKDNKLTSQLWLQILAYLVKKDQIDQKTFSGRICIFIFSFYIIASKRALDIQLVSKFNLRKNSDENNECGIKSSLYHIFKNPRLRKGIP